MILEFGETTVRRLDQSILSYHYLLILLGLLPLLGCGPGTGKVKGIVKTGERPLPGGIVTFVPESGTTRSIELDESGGFELVLPVGSIKIAVDNRKLNPDRPTIPVVIPDGLSPEIKEKIQSAEEEKAKPKGKPDRYIPIDSRYYQVESSGLTIQVRGGPQSEEIKLQPVDP